MHEAVIVDAVRTPFGKYSGGFRDTHPQDLAAAPLRALQERNEFDPSTIDDVLLGCVKPVYEQGSTIGRIAPMVAGWGDEVPGLQIDRMCGSSQQSVNFAAATVRAGFQDVVVAGGIEHMTRVPMDANRTGSKTPKQDMTDTYFDHFDEMVNQGESAERIAEKWGFDRTDVDEIAVESQRRWKAAWDDGRYDSHVVPVETTLDGDPTVVDVDEHPRPGTDLDTLGSLPLAFRESDGVIHAGNSSGIVDGASAVLVTSAEVAAEHGWEPMARIVETQVVGVDPVMMLTGPIPATEQVLEAADMSIDDVDLFEVNEAFASVLLAWLEETGAPWDRTNVNGGAIAHGHPLGATGGALITKLVHELERTGEQTALSTMCIGLGQGIATIIERV